MNQLYFPDRARWREWLSENHRTESEVWLVYYKKESGKISIPYEDSVLEALCFGWIDSIIKNLDDESYARKFTPRKEKSAWSEANKKRVGKLLKEGSMTEHGMRLVEAAKQNGIWDKPAQRPQLTFVMHPAFAEALRSSPAAAKTYESLSLTGKKQYLAWIETAKRPETLSRRIAESIKLLEQGQELGLR